MAEKYTEESLRNGSRAELRQLGMKLLSKSAREVSEMKSDEIISSILALQGGAPAKKKAEPEPQPEGKARGRKKEPEPEEQASPGNGVAVGRQLDSLGKALDDLAESMKARIADIETQQYVMAGLISDIWKINDVGGPDELEARIDELQKECTEGND